MMEKGVWWCDVGCLRRGEDNGGDRAFYMQLVMLYCTVEGLHCASLGLLVKEHG